nr:kinesin-related protein 6 isoform X2 [Ziziphus jujuba var. spinosa]
MKIKNKGKVYPSPSSSSSSSSDIDVLSVLKLLPAAILALVSVLSFEDREVLAYMITRSMKTSATTATTSSMVVVQESKKKSSSSKKGSSSSSSSSSSYNNNNNNFNSNNNTHKPPVFDCDCFDCYTSYWLRWNSSANRELMDQAIEAFEDQLTNGEKNKKTQKSTGRGKRRDKIGGRRDATKAVADVKVQSSVSMPEIVDVLPAENHVVPVTSPEKSDEGKNGKEDEEEVSEDVGGGEVSQAEEEEDEDMPMFVRTATANNHKGLARKFKVAVWPAGSPFLSRRNCLVICFCWKMLLHFFLFGTLDFWLRN